MEWKAYRASLGYEKQSGRNETILKEFMDWTEITHVEDINRQSLQAWTVHLSNRVKPKTVKNKLTCVVSFCNWCVLQEIILAAPRIETPKIENRLPRFLSPAEYEQVLTLAREHDCYLEVFIPLKTGMRLSELRLIDWEDFYFDQKILMLNKTKSNRPRSIPLNRELIGVLESLAAKNKGPVFPGRNYDGCSGRSDTHTFIDRLNPIRKKMPGAFTEGMAEKATGRCYHIFRHTFAVRAAMAGVPIPVLQGWMGHEDIKTTMIYAKFSPDSYSEHIEKI